MTAVAPIVTIQGARDFAHRLVLADVGKTLVVKADHTGFELATPGSGGDAATLQGHAAAYFEVAGASVAAVAAHVGLPDPHTQYLLNSQYTAADVLAKLLTVDGAGSGLDADLLDGNSSSAFLLATGATTGATSQAQAFTNGIVAATVRGGTAANDDITIEGTSNATRTTSYVLIQPNGGNVGIGPSAPVTAALVSIASATVAGELLRVGGDSTLYWTFVNSGNPTTRVILRGVVASATAFQFDPLGTNFITTSLVLGTNTNVDGATFGIRQNANGIIASIESATGLDLFQLTTAGGSDASKRAILTLFNIGTAGIVLNALSGSFINGTLSIGQNNAPGALADIGAGTTANASARIRGGVDPTSPNDGDLWYNSRFKFRRSTTTELVATGVQATGGAATASGTWTATEQGMLQKIYDAGRTFGLLN